MGVPRHPGIYNGNVSIRGYGNVTHARHQTTRRDRTHFRLRNCEAREEFATRRGMSEEKLRKAILMVGSRVATLTLDLKV